MKAPYKTKVNGKYGAPMGRPDSLPEEPITEAHLHRMRLIDGDYDEGGAYWGCGMPMFCCFGDGFEFYFRARDQEAAEDYLIETYPEITVLHYFEHSIEQLLELEDQEYYAYFIRDGYDDFIRCIAKEFELSERMVALLERATPDQLIELYESMIPSGDYHYMGSPRPDMAAEHMQRDQLAAFLFTVKYPRK